MMTRLLCLIGLLFVQTAAIAAPVQYQLDRDLSQVGFSYEYGSGTGQGVMPVKSADIRLDLGNLPASQVTVTLNAQGARTGFLPATRAMKGPEVLHTARHPDIHFQSTQFVGNLNAAKVHGNLTIRGVTQPVTLSAKLYRQHGTQADDLSRLTIRLTGSVSRAAYGAKGFAQQVGDQITLDIFARINL